MLIRIAVANVPDAESQYHAHEFLDATVQPKPIYISPNEVYAMHGLLSHHLDGLVSTSLATHLLTNNRPNSRRLNAATLCGRSSRSWAASLIWVMMSSVRRVTLQLRSSSRTVSPMFEVRSQPNSMLDYLTLRSLSDPHAEEKTLWVQAKRGVLAILRVQPAKDLVESLMKPVTEEHEATWEEIVENETITDHRQQRSRRMPSTTGAEYRLEDIRS